MASTSSSARTHGGPSVRSGPRSSVRSSIVSAQAPCGRSSTTWWRSRHAESPCGVREVVEWRGSACRQPCLACVWLVLGGSESKKTPVGRPVFSCLGRCSWYWCSVLRLQDSLVLHEMCINRGRTIYTPFSEWFCLVLDKDFVSRALVLSFLLSLIFRILVMEGFTT